MTSRSRNSLLTGVVVLVSVAVALYFTFRPDTHDESRPVAVQSAFKAPLVISVQAHYPGANAQVVADTVAAPIEQQIDGIEHLRSMTSRSANDGAYNLQLTFNDGIDLDLAMALVQKRISLAAPSLPALVNQQGVTVRKKSIQPLLLVTLTSPDRRYDDLFLSNYAAINVSDELAHLTGVGDVMLLGQRDEQLSVTLDADKLAAHNVSVSDVMTAISQQNLQVSAGRIGQAPLPKGQQIQLKVITVGRLVEPDQLQEIIVKVTATGHILRLKEVAHADRVRSQHCFIQQCYANLNEQSAALLAIHPQPNAKPSDVSRGVIDKLAELGAKLPQGLALNIAFDFAPHLEEPNNPATPEHLVIDVQLPDGVSMERTTDTINRVSELLRRTSGIKDVLALTEHPFSPLRRRPCLVASLTAKNEREFTREQFSKKLSSSLRDQIPDATFQISWPRAEEGVAIYGFPIELAIEDRGGHGREALLQRAESLAAKMNENEHFKDASIGPGLRNAPILILEIDRVSCKNLGVETSEIFKTLEANLGTLSISNFNAFGRSWRMSIPMDRRFRAQTSDLRSLSVKNKDGQIVPMRSFLEIRDRDEPVVIERHNMYPAVRITANLNEGVSLSEAKAICEKLGEQELDPRRFGIIFSTAD